MSKALLAAPRRAAILTLALAVGLAACDSSPSGPHSDASTPAVIAGGIQFAGGGGASAQDLSGVEVVVESDGAADITDTNGAFRIVTSDVDGQVRLRFRKGAMDVTLDLSGITAGTMFTLTVTLSDTSATVADSTSSELDEFEGEATLLSVSGSAPNRTLSIEVAAEANRRYAVDVVESATTFEADGDLLTFEALLTRLQANQQVRVEGDGNAQSDGRVVATSIKAETDDDDDDDGEDDEDFEGDVTEMAVSGVAPTRTARVTLVDDSVSTTVDIIEGTTVFDTDGDVLTFEAMLSAHASGAELEVEGDGELGQDGVWTASFIEVETDDDGDDDEDDEDNDDEEFEGDVTALAVSGTAPARTARLTLVDDSVTTMVDIIEGTTVFDTDGDILTFEAMLAAHASGKVLEVEGEGDLGQDGVWTARTVEVEID